MINETMGAQQAVAVDKEAHDRAHRDEQPRALGIEAVDGGFIITRNATGRDYELGRHHSQSVVPSADALVGLLARWANDHEARQREGKRAL